MTTAVQLQRLTMMTSAALCGGLGQLHLLPHIQLMAAWLSKRSRQAMWLPALEPSLVAATQQQLMLLLLLVITGVVLQEIQ
jgi:hypothetical protein